MKAGEATVEVRLLNTKTGEAVPDAVIFASRLDMAPDGMAGMTTPAVLGDKTAITDYSKL